MSVFIEPSPSFIPDTKQTIITGHTWYDKTAHLYRSNTSKLIRCQIKEIVLRECFIGLRVNFREDGHIKHKHLDPNYILALNLFWIDRTVVSDDDELNGLPSSSPLPDLFVFTNEMPKLSEHQSKAVQWFLQQTNEMRSLMMCLK
jgi:hypothetical protein